ncbi:hypothetical protein [Rheinheimera baltica]|nr:hypothetical protein [Rheinheimera baltica]
MNHETTIFEEFAINELEDRVEFSTCTWTGPDGCEKPTMPECHAF